MRVLVTGGAGYIGSHAAKALHQRGIEPVVFDNLSEGHRWAVRWGPLVEGDLADQGLIFRTLRAYRIEAVMHFAASAYVGESMEDPRKYFRNNTVNTLNLLDAMQDAGVRHIVFSSTCATYGIPDRLPISEDMPQRPVNPYGESKLAIERMLCWYGQAYSLRWASLRYFNAAGADPDGEIGHWHEPETHAIPLMVRAARGTGEPFHLFGTDYPTSDGTAIRDYIHVTDLADAHVRALDYLGNGCESRALNLGAGHGHSVREVIAAVEQVTGRQVPVREAPRRTGDPAALVADPTRARRVLGWQARLSDLHTIVETAVGWQERLIQGGRAAHAS